MRIPGDGIRRDIRNRIGAGLLLVCGLVAAVAFDWRPMAERDIGDRFGPPRRPVTEPFLALPARIHQCETFTARVCGTWTLRSAGVYRARWDDGATGTVRVFHFDGTSVVARRVDDGPGGRTAFYEGLVVDNQLVYSGSVRRTDGSESQVGGWSAEWEPPAHPANTRERTTQ